MDELFFGPDFLSEEDDAPKFSLKEGELREVSILFADIKGFTNISNLFEPEVIHEKMDEVMKIFSKCINFYGGFVDKYIGDGIMALFGAKQATEQDTQRAVLAAIKMQEQLRLYNKLLNRQPNFESLELGLRIGINTGLVSVGKVGESREGDFTVYGPQVNLASRMESNAPVNRIMMPASTMHLVENIFDFENLGPIMVKGMDDPVDCWLVKGQKIEPRQDFKTTFIGRDQEMDELSKSYEQSRDSAQILGLKGDAGIGKTRLVQEFCEHRPEALILSGICSSISPSPFNLFARIFENYFRIRHNDTVQSRKEALEKGIKDLAQTSTMNSEEIRDALPLIGLIMEIRYDDPRIKLKGKDLLDHLLRAVESVFMAIISLGNTNHDGIILILDDIHMIDDASAQALSFVLDRFDAQNVGILILALYRLDYEILNTIKNHRSFKEIEILAFSPDKIDELVMLYTKGMELSKQTLELVRELSNGNPFFLEEWCKYIGKLPKTEMDEYPVPANLHALILSRLDKLPQDLRIMLHKAAVIGNEFFVEILREVEKRLDDPINIESSLHYLENHSLIMRMLGFDFSTYFFKHITTREVAYRTLLQQNRKLLHQLTAESIEALFKDRLDDFCFVLADHYLKAEIPEKALPYLQKSVDMAIKVYDHSTALKLGNELLKYLHENAQKADLYVKLADVLWVIGNWDEASEFIDNAESLCSKDSPTLCEIHRFRGVAAFYMGDFDTALTEFKAGLSQAEQINDDLSLCIAYNNLGIWHQHHRDFTQAIQYHEEGLVISQKLGDAQRQAKTHSNLGLIYLDMEDFDKAFESFNLSLEISREHRLMRDESIALGNLGWACLLIQQYDDALPWLEQKLELASKMNDKLEMIKALGNLGNLYFEKENYQKALEYYEQSLELKQKLGNKQEIENSKKMIAITQEKILANSAT
nr:adenylate cyclase [Candidatus Cloacimonadota bacterium]